MNLPSRGTQTSTVQPPSAALRGFRILKSSEVDILADGPLDYPDELLQELDYTVCSIHSRFGLGREEQTERTMRAMDNRYFNILGHATGRLPLKRRHYEIEIDRIVDHARENGCFFEINSSSDRLDLLADNARRASAAGVMIAVSTDSHSTREFQLIRCASIRPGAPDWKNWLSSTACRGKNCSAFSKDRAGLGNTESERLFQAARRRIMAAKSSNVADFSSPHLRVADFPLI